MDLDPPFVHAPDFPPSTWINALDPVSLESLRGRVVLIDFWDFTCVNCLRGLPYLRAWHARYEEAGLTVIGVHTPEFAFAQDVFQVKTAAGRLGIRYPVILDNDQAVWTAYATRCWPTKHLVDARGYVRGVRQGEGGYAEIEAAIQTLLRERDPQVGLPDLLEPVRPEDVRGAVCLPTTPELQIDAVATELRQESTEHALPPERPEGRIYIAGSWRTTTNGMMLEAGPGSVVLPYRAASVNAVLAAPIDPDRSSNSPLSLEILQDGHPLAVDHFGEDIRLDGSSARLIVGSPRSYALVQNPEVGPHELRLIIDQPGLAFYAFSFGTCRVPEMDLASDLTE